ncbi:MAG: insulinase family protein [Alphaproteobacteria bacterium]|nr:insulinase family protein [Alphaproteobacteria bacterium]
MRLLLVLLGFFACVPQALYANPVQIIKSPKGISAWLIEDHSLPIVSIAFAWRGGIEQDALERQGLSRIAAMMLTKGAGKDDENAFQKKLEDHAISLSFEARRDAVFGQMRSLKETLPVATNVLRDSLVTPRFDTESLNRLKIQSLSTLKHYQADPEWLLSRLMMREGFAGHVYSKRTLGSEATLQSITRDDLTNWHKHLSRDQLLVSVTGDINKEELGALLDKTFGDLPEKAEQPVVADTTLNGKKELFLLRYAGPQSSMILLWPGIDRHDKDWYAAEVMNYILGGGSFSSRLMNEIRAKRGLTYGISSGMSNYDHAFTYAIQASFKNEKAGEVLALVKQELARIRDTAVSAQEIKAAKDYLIGSYALGLTSTARVAGHYLDIQREQLGVNNQQEHEAGIRAVTAQDIQRVAKRIVQDDAMIAFFIGQPQGITPTKTFETVD